MILDIENICGAIDNNLAYLIHTVIVIIKIGIPVLLIIFGMLDIGKGVVASKEDEIKKGQQMFIKRLISAVLVFFVVSIVQLVIGLADDKDSSEESGIWNCANMILNGKIDNSKKLTPDEPKENTNEPSQKIKDCCTNAGGTINDKGQCANLTDADKYLTCKNSM